MPENRFYEEKNESTGPSIVIFIFNMCNKPHAHEHTNTNTYNHKHQLLVLSSRVVYVETWWIILYRWLLLTFLVRVYLWDSRDFSIFSVSRYRFFNMKLCSISSYLYETFLCHLGRGETYEKIKFKVHLQSSNKESKSSKHEVRGFYQGNIWLN